MREAKTVFGCANLILQELGYSPLKTAQGINTAIEIITKCLKSIFATGNIKLFVIVLDEFDSIFNDKRNNPSDLVFELLLIQEKLRVWPRLQQSPKQSLKEKETRIMTIVAISDNTSADQDLDYRIRSRIGSSEIFFSMFMGKKIF